MLQYKYRNGPRPSTHFHGSTQPVFIRKINLLLDKLNFPVTILWMKCPATVVRVLSVFWNNRCAPFMCRPWTWTHPAAIKCWLAHSRCVYWLTGLQSACRNNNVALTWTFACCFFEKNWQLLQYEPIRVSLWTLVRTGTIFVLYNTQKIMHWNQWHYAMKKWSPVGMSL